MDAVTINSIKRQNDKPSKDMKPKEKKKKKKNWLANRYENE